jgi:hypothetical protein
MVTVEAVGQIGTTVEGVESGRYATVEDMANVEVHSSSAAASPDAGHRGLRAQPARPPAARGGVGQPATSRRSLAHEAARRGSGDTAEATVTFPARSAPGLRNSLHVSTTSTVPWSAQTRT